MKEQFQTEFSFRISIERKYKSGILFILLNILQGSTEKPNLQANSVIYKRNFAKTSRQSIRIWKGQVVFCY